MSARVPGNASQHRHIITAVCSLLCPLISSSFQSYLPAWTFHQVSAHASLIYHHEHHTGLYGNQDKAGWLQSYLPFAPFPALRVNDALARLQRRNRRKVIQLPGPCRLYQRFSCVFHVINSHITRRSGCIKKINPIAKLFFSKFACLLPKHDHSAIQTRRNPDGFPLECSG